MPHAGQSIKFLAKQAVHHSGLFYRDQELSIPIAPLEKKKYSSSKEYID